MNFLNHVNFTKNELQNAVIQNLSSAPGSPVAGLVYFDTTLNKFGCYNGSAWEYFSDYTDVVTQVANSGSSGRLKVSAGTNKVISDYTTAGIVKVAANVAAAAVAETDYTSPTGVGALTNKTINAANNTISNLQTSMFAANVVDTDGTLAANSDTRIPSQKAVKTYVDALNTSDMNYVGAIDCSANPNYPASTKGDYYKISVAGKIGGASGTNVSAGDAVICNTTNAGGTEAAVGTNFDIIQANVEQATTATLGIVALADATVAEAKSNTTKALTAASVVNFPIKKTFTIGDGVATSYNCTHNLGTTDVIVSVRYSTGDIETYPDIRRSSANIVVVEFRTPPASNEFKVTIIG